MLIDGKVDSWHLSYTSYIWHLRTKPFSLVYLIWTSGLHIFKLLDGANQFSTKYRGPKADQHHNSVKVKPSALMKMEVPGSSVTG